MMLGRHMRGGFRIRVKGLVGMVIWGVYRRVGWRVVGVREVTKANPSSPTPSLVIKRSKVISEVRFKSIIPKLNLLKTLNPKPLSD